MADDFDYQTQRAARSRQHRRRDAQVVSRLRDVGHHRPRAARRPRRPQAGAPPHPLRDVRAGEHRRQGVQEIGAHRRRRDGQVPPARRQRDLRRGRAHGAGLLDALPARRRPGQLRLARRRQPGGDALHRGPPHAARRRADARRHRQGDGRLGPELRRHRARAVGASREVPEPPGQRLLRHRRRHGHEHPAAQPRRGDRRLPDDDREPAARRGRT